MLPAEPLRLRPPRQLVSRRAITWWTTQAALEVTAVLVPLVVALVAWVEARSWLTGVTVAVVIIGLGYVLVMPRWRFRVHRWETTDDAVYTSAGWISQEWRVAPMSRIQTVDTERGPLQQLFGLSTVTVTTASAAGALRLAGLDHALADELVEQLTQTTQATRGGCHMTPTAADWQRLDPRMLAVTPLRQLAAFLPVIAVVLIIGVQQDLGGRVYGVAVGVLVVVLAGVLRWVTTRYRITTERVELRSGLLFRSARSIPRDRIRSVDVTAGPVHRLFRLSVVTVGTGEHSEGIESRELSLDAISAAEADRLRQRLLESSAASKASHASDAGDPDLHGATAAPSSTELATLDWSWLRFAPLTASSLVAVGAVAGAFGQLVGELGAELADVGGVRERLSAAPLWLGISAFAVLVLVIALLGSVLIFVESWWGFKLVREPGGTLRIRRGLLTARSVSLEERRLRGVAVVEPLLLRAGRGARTGAVATGLGSGRGTLLPPAPREEAHRVSGLVLTEDPSPTRTALRRHPPVALRRRLARAVLPVLAGAAVLWLIAVPTWVVWATLGLLPVTLLLAVDAYRNLGHALTSRYLVTRHGAGMRGTVALQRSGVIGWTVSQSFFQRRAGLVTVTATTAAGSGAYRVIDVATADGLAVAERAVPGLLTPFLLQHVVTPPAH